MRAHAKKRWGKLFLATGTAISTRWSSTWVENENVELILVETVNTMSEELRPYAQEIVDFGTLGKELSR